MCEVNSLEKTERLKETMQALDAPAMPWEVEPWHAEQRSRWDALEADGWKFGRPPALPSKVGIWMYHGQYQRCAAIFYVDKRMAPRDIHTFLLETCERFAQANSVRGE